jgi:glutamyl-tRNA synthetase
MHTCDDIPPQPEHRIPHGARPQRGHDGRFAPSPTGALHLGNLRTAVLAWLCAKSQGGRFIVRVEDLDSGRVVAGMEAEQLADLAALGLTSDAVPERQSDRHHQYEAALQHLQGRGLTYPCFCTRAEIRMAASAPHGPAPEGAYPGTCRELSEDKAQVRITRGDAHCLRLKADGTAVAFQDQMLGEVEAIVDDLVLVRRDGDIAYNLAVVVDDADQGIGEVVRGADLAHNTPRQLWLARALRIAEPATFRHVPLVLGPDGNRLAKRHGGVTLAEWTAAGRTATDLLGWIAHSLGLGAAHERITLSQLLDRFDPAAIPPDPVVLGTRTPV